MSVLRVAFLIENASFFKNISYSNFFYGAYFDLVTIALLSLPLLIFVHPFVARLNQTIKRIISIIIKGYLALISFFILFLNIWDIAYFSYTQKRSSFSYFWHILTGTETRSLVGEFLAEFWWLPVVFLVLSWALFKVIKAVHPFEENQGGKWPWGAYLLSVFLVIILARGGVQLRPVGIVDATAMSSLEQAPIVLNTAFTVLKSINDKELHELKYFKENELASLLHHPNTTLQGGLPPKTNVVIIILESFGTNYVGPQSPHSYAPFLDSLLKESLYFEYAIANGRTSMDAVPAILGGMPSWLAESYILSNYCSNKLSSLPQILKNQGYSTSFYHGAKEGSMGFKSFTKAIGIDDYYGLESYPNPAHFDGNWGIWDHHMLNFFGKSLAKQKQPFFSTVFTLTSHHPYKTPKVGFKNLQSGLEPLCKTISYTDQSLRSFFKRYCKSSWFENTLFVITADHVGPTRQNNFQTLDWRYRIPIAFYHPKIKIPYPNKGVVFQQIDILPTLLDLLGIERPKFQLGSSCYDDNQSMKMVYDNGNLISFNFDGTNLIPIAWTPGIKRQYTEQQKPVSQKMVALYQFYLNSLINNRSQ